MHLTSNEEGRTLLSKQQSELSISNPTGPPVHAVWDFAAPSLPSSVAATHYPQCWGLQESQSCGHGNAAVLISDFENRNDPAHHIITGLPLAATMSQAGFLHVDSSSFNENGEPMLAASSWLLNQLMSSNLLSNRENKSTKTNSSSRGGLHLGPFQSHSTGPSSSMHPHSTGSGVSQSSTPEPNNPLSIYSQNIYKKSNIEEVNNKSAFPRGSHQTSQRVTEKPYGHGMALDCSTRIDRTDLNKAKAKSTCHIMLPTTIEPNKASTSSELQSAHNRPQSVYKYKTSRSQDGQDLSPKSYARRLAERLPKGKYAYPRLQYCASKGEYRIRFLLDGYRRERSLSTKIRINGFAEAAATELVRLIQLKCVTAENASHSTRKVDSECLVSPSSESMTGLDDRSAEPTEMLPTGGSLPVKEIREEELNKKVDALSSCSIMKSDMARVPHGEKESVTKYHNEKEELDLKYKCKSSEDALSHHKRRRQDEDPNERKEKKKIHSRKKQRRGGFVSNTTCGLDAAATEKGGGRRGLDREKSRDGHSSTLSLQETGGVAEGEEEDHAVATVNSEATAMATGNSSSKRKRNLVATNCSYSLSLRKKLSTQEKKGEMDAEKRKEPFIPLKRDAVHDSLQHRNVLYSIESSACRGSSSSQPLVYFSRSQAAWITVARFVDWERSGAVKVARYSSQVEDIRHQTFSDRFRSSLSYALLAETYTEMTVHYLLERGGWAWVPYDKRNR